VKWCTDGAGADGDVIVIEVDLEIDICCFLLSILGYALNVRVLFTLVEP